MRLLALAASAAALLVACDATNTTPDVSQAGAPEDIPGATLVLARAPNDTIRVTVDGLNGGAPTFSPDTLELAPGRTYPGYIRLAGGADAEVRAEAESHTYTYAFSSDAATMTRADRESQYTNQNLNRGDYAFGRRFVVRTGPDAVGVGVLSVALFHFDGPPKADAEDSRGTVDFSFELPVLYQVPR